MRILNLACLSGCILSATITLNSPAVPCGALRLTPAKTTVQTGETSDLLVTMGYSNTATPFIPTIATQTNRQFNVSVDGLPITRYSIPAETPIDPFIVTTIRLPISFDTAGLKRIAVNTLNASRQYPDPPNCSFTEPATAFTEIIVEAKPLVAPLAVGYSGLWWNPKTSGQGVFITQNTPSNIAYLGWFTYDQTGVARWYVGDNCYVQNNSCTTTIYETRGASFDGTTFNNANLKLDAVGTATVTFASNQAATMVYTLKTSGGKLDLVRQPF